jgi:hypothetical protein
MVNSQVAGTTQYIEWLILNERVQPSLIAGVAEGGSISQAGVYRLSAAQQAEAAGVCIYTATPPCERDAHGV